MREYLIEAGQSALPFVGSAKPVESPESVAGRIRAVLGFSADWAVHFSNAEEARRALRDAMERTGILVVANSIVGNNTSRSLDPDEFRGFVLSDEYAPLVFVNAADAKSAQMFTLAHELAHLFFGLSAAFDLKKMMPAKDPIERVCNRVAAEFLVPEHEFRSAWTSEGANPYKFFDLASRFKVSPVVAARRALDLRLTDRERFFSFYEKHTAQERQVVAAHGGDFYKLQPLRIGRRLAEAVVLATREGASHIRKRIH